MRALPLALCAAVMLSAAGCKTSTGTAVATDEIVIGEYGFMTGSEANFGQNTHNGVQMAVDEINAVGGVAGKKVKLVSYDDQGKTSEVGTVVTRLVSGDHALAIIGEVASSLSVAGGQVAQQYGVPMITPSSTNPKVTEVGDFIFRVCFIDPFQGYVLARFITDGKDKSGLGLKKVAILFDQRQSYSQGLARDFEAALTKMGGEIVGKESYQGGDQDFSAQLTRIKSQNPDAIFIPGYYTEVASIARQVRGLGITAPLVGGDGWESVQDIGGDAIQGAYYSNHYATDEPRPEVKTFTDKYNGRYHKVPDSMAALGYDAMMLIKDAIARNPAAATSPLTDGRKALREAISQTKDFPGVTGKITIDPSRNARKQAVVLKIVGKSSVTAASIPPP